MSIRFNHVFATLLLLSGALAFLLPEQLTQAHVPALEALFVPVSRPTGALARWMRTKVRPDISTDSRPAEQIIRENEALKDEVSSLSAQLETWKAIARDRSRIGDILSRCTPFTVVGGDSGSRASLAIAGSRWQGLRDGMCVLYPGGIAGQIRRAGTAGARVQLLTDLGFRARIGFVRFDGAKEKHIVAPQGLAEGNGRGVLLIRGLTRDDVHAAGLAPGDWVVLNEPDWPADLQGRHLGRITSIGPRADAPLFDQIVVEPPQNLQKLTEVLVLTGEPFESSNE